MERVLEQRGSHQLVRTQGYSNSSSGHEVTSSEQDGLLIHRQHHGGGVSQSSRGTHSLALLRLTFRIWKLAEQLKVMIIPRHIAGQRNVLAEMC